VSSCRETIRTLGCLQAVAIVLGGVMHFTNPDWMRPFRFRAACWILNIEGPGLRVQPLRNCDTCSFRQIVAFFWTIANPFLIKVRAGMPIFPLRDTPNAPLKGNRKRTYTKYGPFQSYIPC
jgi:hypothetical protein